MTPLFSRKGDLKDNAFGLKAPESQTATLGIIANAWLDVQPVSLKSGILAFSSGGTDKFGRGKADIVGTKGSVEKLFREFATDITHMGFAEYAPPPVEQPRKTVPGFGRKS